MNFRIRLLYPSQKCVVKPIREGSSLAVTICQSLAELAPAVDGALCFDDEILVGVYTSCLDVAGQTNIPPTAHRDVQRWPCASSIGQRICKPDVFENRKTKTGVRPAILRSLVDAKRR